MQRQIWIILINKNNHQSLNVTVCQVACKAFWGACFNVFADHGVSFRSVKTLSTGFGSSSFCLILIDVYVDISGRTDSTDRTAVGVEVDFWPRI